ncbi:MAG: DNA-directed polymerase subunit alpha [Sphingomonadales bacterium]|jgi:hypothetical protein|nr:DNA-directed polymerase subunit alpha [Sphingomonadales bacterium]MEA3045588.1 DNA-directed polymerase subunit alpha [Sphingomonadales bacterium]MEA3048126.1 DNA-directed polymerase subunit alpha [Sphingomonadales bacterium]
MIHASDFVRTDHGPGATLNIELTAETGKGYVPAAANRPVDALYSPVRQDGQAAPSPGQGWTSRGDVHLPIYKVENTRPSTPPAASLRIN